MLELPKSKLEKPLPPRKVNAPPPPIVKQEISLLPPPPPPRRAAPGGGPPPHVVNSDVSKVVDRYHGELPTRNLQLRRDAFKVDTEKGVTKQSKARQLTEKSFLVPGIQSRPYSLEEIQVAFEAIDADKKGYIDMDALRDALQLCGENASEEEMRTMLRLVDADASAEVGFDEFREQYEDPPQIFKNFDMSNVQAQRLAAITLRQEANAELLGGKQERKLSRDERIEILTNIAMEMGEEVSPQFIKRLYENFLAVDKDGSGLLDYKEYLCVVGKSDSEDMQRLFNHFDTFSSGEIELKEFIVGISLYTSASVIDKLKFAFLIFDDDSSGFLERKEILEMLKTTHPELSPQLVESRVDEIYSLLGLQPIHRVSYERFMKVATERPALLIESYAQSKSLKQEKEDKSPTKEAQKVISKS